MIIVFGQYHSTLIDALEAMSEPYVILKDAKRYADDDDAIDFSDESSVLEAARSVTPQPKALIAMYEQYIPFAARISHELGIAHSLSYEAAMNATDKVAMRLAFDTKPGISPAHAEANDLQTARDFVARYGYPVIVKPANLSKSLLIARCDSDTELVQTYASILSLAPSLYKKYTLGQTPKFIIEQFMEGSIHTLAGFVDSQGIVSYAPGIVDNVSARDAGYDDTFIFQRTLPTRLSEQQQADAYGCASKAINALGLRSCPAHVEIIMTKDGARIIEIGARLGGYRPLMYELSSGVKLLEAAIQTYLGALPEFSPSGSASCAVIELFPRQNGIISRVDGMDEIAQLKSVYKVRQAKSVGDLAGRAADGHKAIAYAILRNDDMLQLNHDAASIQQLFNVQIAT